MKKYFIAMKKERRKASKRLHFSFILGRII